jgi:hypothetical protein
MKIMINLEYGRLLSKLCAVQKMARVPPMTVSAAEVLDDPAPFAFSILNAAMGL